MLDRCGLELSSVVFAGMLDRCGLELSSVVFAGMVYLSLLTPVSFGSFLFLWGSADYAHTRTTRRLDFLYHTERLK